MLKRESIPKFVGMIVLLAVMCALPFVLRTYYVEVVILLLINIILVVSYRIMCTMGYWSLAHLAMMGSGAYTYALLARYFGVPFWIGLPIGGLAGVAWAMILSYPLVRMKGFAFFIGSYAAGEAMRLAWIEFRYPFGGSTGLINIPPPSLGTINFLNSTPYYFLVLIVVAACIFFMYRVDKSRIGGALRSIASEPVLAECIGINITRYKTMAFAIAAFFAAIAGVLLVGRLGAVDPKLFNITPSLYLLIWALIGGTRTIVGPIIGVSVITAVFEGLRVFEEMRPIFVGVVLIIFMLFLPDGLESIPRRISAGIAKLRQRSRGAGVNFTG